MKTLLVNIYGRVQGVGFRYFAQKTALAHRVMGMVKNEVDGSVTLKVTAPSSILDVFLQAIEVGNGYSRVDCMSIEEVDTIEYNDFRVE